MVGRYTEEGCVKNFLGSLSTVGKYLHLFYFKSIFNYSRNYEPIQGGYRVRKVLNFYEIDFLVQKTFENSTKYSKI